MESAALRCFYACSTDLREYSAAASVVAPPAPNVEDPTALYLARHRLE
jgi:hypothetical protein